KRLKKLLAWKLYQRRDLTEARYHHATADSEARNLRAYDLGVPICTVPNGVDLPEPSFPDTETQRDSGTLARFRTALFLGRSHPKNGLPLLISAWAEVQPADWFLDIAGPDEAEHAAEIKRLIWEKGLESVVRIIGPIAPDQKSALYRRADLLVLPTHSEN